MTPMKYHPALIALHWLLAFMIVLSLCMGSVVLKELSNASPGKLAALRGHMLAGISILALMLARLVVRLRTAKPAPASLGNPMLDGLKVATHYGLYALVILMAASGIALSQQAGLPGAVFGGSGAALPESFGAFSARLAHGLVAKALVALVALHALAALYHHLVRRDGLLLRMGFGNRQPSERL